MTKVLCEIELIKADITKVSVDAIVNAANNSLMGGGGVDGAIHREGGPEILEECRKIVDRQGECKTGEAVITIAGKLPSKFVIHTVGPVWNGGQAGERDQLANCYRNSIKLAVENHCRTLAFPNISTGIYGFPKEEAAKVAVEAVLNFIATTGPLEKIIFVCYDEKNFTLYKKELDL